MLTPRTGSKLKVKGINTSLLIRCAHSQLTWCSRKQLWSFHECSWLVVMETGLGRPSQPTCGARHRGYGGKGGSEEGGGKEGAGWEDEVRKTKHVIFPRGPSGAGPGWMPPKQCYFISLMGHNNRCTFHHLSFGVIIGFPAINSTRIPINLSVWLTICVVTLKR